MDTVNSVRMQWRALSTKDTMEDTMKDVTKNNEGCKNTEEYMKTRWTIKPSKNEINITTNNDH
ncbi:unnamed protein product [Sphenostylis stenocarpa]|uniref:Uncharacterized protein n=1 Tax=Sphenostylis stenocarpa TaxID=92480 RepID=A0AA86SR48_9FABA|nr:unnamed protein product [Sphenostylis stenocarpa]